MVRPIHRPTAMSEMMSTNMLLPVPARFASKTNIGLEPWIAGRAMGVSKAASQTVAVILVLEREINHDLEERFCGPLRILQGRLVRDRRVIDLGNVENPCLAIPSRSVEDGAVGSEEGNLGDSFQHPQSLPHPAVGNGLHRPIRWVGGCQDHFTIVILLG